MFYWVTFSDHDAGTIEAISFTEAQRIAGGIGTPATIETLPYPASPGLFRTTATPSFCYSPARCSGATACPNTIACTS